MYKKTALLSSIIIAFSASQSLAFAGVDGSLHVDNTGALHHSTLRSPSMQKTVVTRNGSDVDPFTGKIGKYENYVNQYNTTNILKKIKKNDLEIAKINHQMDALNGNVDPQSSMAGGPSKAVNSENAVLSRQVAALHAQVSQLHAQFVKAERAVVKKREMDNTPRLVAIMGDAGDRTALIRMGHAVHSFRSGSSFGAYRVGKVTSNGVMVYGPNGGNYIRLSQVGAIGVMDAAAPMVTNEDGGGENDASMGQQAAGPHGRALNAQLLRESGVHVLPPRPGMPSGMP
ncbi:hypothetical protein [Acidithiobacillus thiooxidans]|uniref:hypothetical protein n=1 Tax=Acidithiobacillus thiooxidans TaxID=930 RepID=UPI0004E15E8D|nr:hypothetical protein [Acidithiobacillus thiooxidans]